MAALRKIRMLPAAFMIILLSGTAATVCGAGSNAALTLKDCIGTAIEKSPLIRASALDVQAAQASLRGSKGALFPRLDLSGLYMKENQSVPDIPAEGVTIPARFSDEFSAWGLYLRVPVYEGGRLVKQVEISKLESEIQSSRESFTLQDVVANVTNTFNKLLHLKALRHAQEKSVEAMEGQRKNTDLLVRTGRVAPVELLRIDVQLASEKQNLIRTVEAITRAKDTLAFLMGVGSDAIQDVAGRLDTDEKIREIDRDQLIKSRPDVVAALKRVEQGKLRVGAAKGKRYPSVSLVGDYGNRAQGVFRDGKEIWEAGVLASINLFDGGIISSEKEREQMLAKKSEEDLRLTERKARLEVEGPCRP